MRMISTQVEFLAANERAKVCALRFRILPRLVFGPAIKLRGPKADDVALALVLLACQPAAVVRIYFGGDCGIIKTIRVHCNVEPSRDVIMPVSDG